MRFLPYILKNLLRKRTRSILTLASVLLPVFVICILGTLVASLDAQPPNSKGMFRLVVRHKVSIANFFPEAYIQKIRQLPGVKEITVFNWFGGRYIDYSAQNIFSRFSVDPDKFLTVFDEAKIVEGSADDWIHDRTGLLAGQMLMKKYGWKIGQKITLTGDIFPGVYELTLRAAFTEADQSTVFFHRAYLEEKVPRFKGSVLMLWIKADSLEATRSLPRQIDALFENSPFPTRTETEKEFQNSWVSLLGNVRLFLTSLVLIISAVIILIAANTMAMAARERVTELAVLRVLGYSRGMVLGLVLGESVLLCLIGGMLGLGLFLVAFPGFHQALLYSPLAGFAAAMRIFPSVLMTAFAVTITVGAFAGLVPAVRAAQRSITDGLRHVG